MNSIDKEKSRFIDILVYKAMLDYGHDYSYLDFNEIVAAVDQYEEDMTETEINKLVSVVGSDALTEQQIEDSVYRMVYMDYLTENNSGYETMYRYNNEVLPEFPIQYYR